MPDVKKMSLKCKEFVNPTYVVFYLRSYQYPAGSAFLTSYQTLGSGLCQQPSAAINVSAASGPQLPRA
jgi:hypothetical protein